MGEESLDSFPLSWAGSFHLIQTIQLILLDLLGLDQPEPDLTRVVHAAAGTAVFWQPWG